MEWGIDAMLGCPKYCAVKAIDIPALCITGSMHVSRPYTFLHYVLQKERIPPLRRLMLK
jgi:hypothetical protein